MSKLKLKTPAPVLTGGSTGGGLSSLDQLSRSLRQRSNRAPSTVCVLAEQPGAAASTAMMLSELGLPASFNQHGIDQANLDNGLMLIIGEQFSQAFLAHVLTGPWLTRLDRVAVFGASLNTAAWTQLHDAGFPFIVKSAPTPQRLLSLLSTMDATIATGLQSTILRRTLAASEIESGADRLYQHIRSGNLGRAVVEARSAFDHFETLLDSASAAHWLSLIQDHHNGTAQHSSLVSAIAMLFARDLGFSPADQRRLFDAAHFHDIGKVEVPLTVLDKPGALDADERALMETHAAAGYGILVNSAETASEIAQVARDHHEYLDGSGYPYGRRGRQIDDVTRMITICDIFAALLERRAYKAPRTAREAYAILLSLEGKLDVTLVKAFSVIAESCAAN